MNIPTVCFSRGQTKWVADAQELADYVAPQARFSEFETKPGECSMCSKTYREQALVDVDVFPGPTFGGGEIEIVFGDRTAGKPFAVFARSSGLFRAYFRCAPGFHEWSSRRLRDLGSTRRQNAGARLVDRILSVPVIRVEGLAATSIE